MMKRFLSSVAVAAIAGPALAQYNCPNVNCQPGLTGRQVNISGATLLRGFFFTSAHTNDFIDVDQDGCSGFDAAPVPPCFPNVVDNLAPTGNYNGWWIVQNRAVGSVEGFNEFITFQLTCDLPEALVTDESTINSQIYATGAGPGSIPGPCLLDIDGDGIFNGAGNPAGTGTPVCPCSIDIAILDVPGRWGAQGPIGDTSLTGFSLCPGEPGYGRYSGLSIPLAAGCATPGPIGSQMASLTRGSLSLNTNTATPDDLTIFDFPFAFAPVVPIANRGTGLQNITQSDLRYLQVTGRAASGENLAAGTRDAGSGTRNAWCNSLNVDPSRGNGDNRGGRTTATSQTNLGSCHRTTNCGSSSHLENGVQQRRLAIGYSGIAGSTAAAADAASGFYEILNVTNDLAGGTSPVRPTVSTILDNCDANTGWRIGGLATFVTRGDVEVSSPRSPGYNPGLLQHMDNEDAADYLYNIQRSIEAFTAPGGSQNADNLFMPGQFLATSFFLTAGLDCSQSLACGDDFGPNPGLNADLQEYIRGNNNLGVSGLPRDGVVTPGFGTRNEAGLVPNRGSAYSYTGADNVVRTVAAGTTLSIRNRVQGDFHYDGVRDCNDVQKMMAAFAAGAVAYTEPGAPLAPVGSDDPTLTNVDANGQNVIIVDILGDMDGSGSFDAADIRYFADGTAMVSGDLCRDCGFTSVDNNWTVALPGRPAGNFFNTSIVRANGAAVAYAAGASRFDVAGSVSGSAPGDSPIGADGIVNEDDLCYIWANQGDWAALSSAAAIDLSCDMNCDLKVDAADARALIEVAWGACLGDLNFNGTVGLEDLSTILARFGAPATSYTEGDLNCDGSVNLSDLSLLLANFGSSGC